ncbi:MAG TPA: formylglycine-generating enzyme family protein [Desulfobacteraceae bacterium]|nr:formylglycine-generating enzyme family protein [Desulfobacteraceae bacterium]
MKQIMLSPVKGLSIFFIVLCLGLAGAFPLFAQESPRTITNDIGMTFIKVSPGSFIMGSPVTERLRDRDEQQHTVTIKAAFYLQETEVTLEQWRAVMGKRWLSKRKGVDDSPVTKVSWYDCDKYINKLNKKSRYTYRLPTEEEWEYACRAGTTTAYSWGDGIDCSKAMYGNNTKKDQECILFYESMKIRPNGPAPVKTFAPNPWGFYDMHGNVWEWCANVYKSYFAEPESSDYSTMDSESRVRRGGSWYKHAHYLRSANRTYGHPNAKFQTTGFRLVLEASE